MASLVNHPLASAVAVSLFAFGVAGVIVLFPDLQWRRRQRRRGSGYLYGGRS